MRYPRLPGPAVFGVTAHLSEGTLRVQTLKIQYSKFRSGPE
jgi:hypothetical protein